MQNKFYRGIRCTCSALIMLASIVIPSLAEAEPVGSQSPNRQTSDAIFNEPRGSVWMQGLYLLGDAVAFYYVKPSLPGSDTLTIAHQKILDIAKSDLPDAQKLEGIHAAEAELAQARLAAIESMQRVGKIPSWAVRYGKAIGTTVVLVDVASRVWIWSALDANPTWSPAVQMIGHVGNSIGTHNALTNPNRDR